MKNRYAIPLAVASLTTAITGIAWAAPRVVPLAIATCATSAACVSASNSSTGPAILGTSASGTGVRAATSGTIAVAALSGSASSGGTGVTGKSSTGPGIEAVSSTSSGALATSAGTNPALSGTAAAGATGAGVEGIAAKGTGIAASGLQAFAGVGQFTTQAAPASTGNLLTLVGNLDPGNAPKLANAFAVDQAGDIYIYGQNPIACGRASQATYLATACLAENKPPASATQRQTLPALAGRLMIRTVRVGQANLIGGSARVALDPALARSLANGRAYHVFLTDAGASSSWLYVADKAAGGFVVREHGNGRSSGTFGFRIVADLRPQTISSAPSKEPL